MFKYLVLFLIFFSVTINCISQQLTAVNKLKTTAKVWGFLKYYHPNVADGSKDWDEHLFNVLSKTNETQTKSEYSKVLLKWINSLGEVKICEQCKDYKNINHFNENFDLNWISDTTLFDKNINKKLKFIELNRHQGINYYANKGNFGYISVSNEQNYKLSNWQNKNIRLLILFRYWNIIEYFFPYKYQTDTKWDTVLEEMIPKFLNAETELDFHLAIRELIVSVDDSHAGFISLVLRKHLGYYSIPADIKIIDNKVIITKILNDSLAKIDNLKVGDVISKINGESIKSLIVKNEKYLVGSNKKSKLSHAYFYLFDGKRRSIEITFDNNGVESNRLVHQYTWLEMNYKKEIPSKWSIIKGNIGYVNMGVLQQNDVSKMFKQLKKTKAIVIDLRNYPHGTGRLISKYISSKINTFYKVITPDFNYPGKFIWRDGYTCGKKGKIKYKGKIVVLVNEQSQSQAEFTTMILQTGNNVTTIGSQTSGADGSVTSFNIIGEMNTQFSGIGIFYPDGTITQRKGVKIDIIVESTIESIKAGKDLVLETAIEFIEK